MHNSRQGIVVACGGASLALPKMNDTSICPWLDDLQVGDSADTFDRRITENVQFYMACFIERSGIRMG